MQASDLFRRLNARVFGYPRWDDKCTLCGEGERFVCSHCVAALGSLQRPLKLQILRHLRSLDPKRARFFERTFQTHIPEDAELLKAFRKAKKWDRKRAAHYLGLPVSVIGNIEMGTKLLPDEIKRKIRKMSRPCRVAKGAAKTPLEAA
jgi:hypothetical protein